MASEEEFSQRGRKLALKHTALTTCKTDSWWDLAVELSLEQWDGAGRQAQEGGDICVIMAGSHCQTAETNTTL